MYRCLVWAGFYVIAHFQDKLHHGMVVIWPKVTILASTNQSRQASDGWTLDGGPKGGGMLQRDERNEA
jgi:hypothetical protein